MKNLIKRSFQTQAFVLQISRYEKEGGKEASLTIDGMAAVFRYPLAFWDKDCLFLVCFSISREGKVLLWLPWHQSWIIHTNSNFSKCGSCSQHDTVSLASYLPLVGVAKLYLKWQLESTEFQKCFFTFSASIPDHLQKGECVKMPSTCFVFVSQLEHLKV